MKKLIICTALFGILSSGVTQALVSTKYTGNCRSLAKESGKYPEKKVKGYKSESTFKKMTQVNQLMADGKKSQARAILNEVKASSSDSFTLSVVHQYLARLAYEANNFNQAVQHARKVVELDALPVNAILGMKKQVAYAYVAKKDYNSAIGWLKQYFDQVIKPPVSDYKTLAQLYYQAGQYRNAICPVYIALKKTTKKKDKKPLYKMLFGMHYQLKDLEGSAKVLTEMINYWPNDKKYWEQLFSIEYQRGNQLGALAVSELAFQKGLWTTEKEIKNLASLHANNGSPYRAAVRLENAMKKGVVAKNLENLKLIARYWNQARDRKKAITAYTNLSSSSNTGKYDYKIGNIYFDQEKYKEAIQYYTKAVNKGNMNGTESGYAFLQMGAAKFYLGQENAALSDLNKAKNYDKTRKNATSWIAFISEKQKLRAQIEKDAQQMIDEEKKKEDTSSE